MGHLARGLALADHLRAQHGLDTIFAGRLEPAAQARVTAAGHALSFWDGKDEADWLHRLVRKIARPVLVCDVRTALSRAELEALKPDVSGLVVLDDATPRRLAADIAYLPPTPEARALPWPDYSGTVRIGWDWVVLGHAPLQRERVSNAAPPWRLLITMGGSDPNGLTLRALRALAPASDDITPIVILGPAFANRSAQSAAITKLWPGARIIQGAHDLRPFMANCDAALTAYGVTAQELAASGTPALYLCLSDDHVNSAAALAETGAGLSLGRHDRLSDASLAQGVLELLRDPARRAAMRARGAEIIDGRGASRIAADLVRLAGGRLKPRAG